MNDADHVDVERSVDIMFVKEMIPHHEQAVVMAERLLDSTPPTSFAIQELARGISAEQTVEIAKMRTVLKEWGVDDDAPSMSALRSIVGAKLFGMDMDRVETRRAFVNDFEMRDGTSGEGMSFTGYAAVFDSPSEPLPFIETIAPGAFTRTLAANNQTKLFVNHDMARVLASNRSGTLRLSEDAHGLRVEADLPPTTDGKDLSILMRKGIVDSMSFGFSTPAGGDVWSEDGATRVLNEVRLHEVSIVTSWPAYSATTAAVRSLDVLAERTGIEAEKLSAAITQLEKGDVLDDELAGILDAAVAKLRSEPEPGEGFAATLSLKQKHIDLLLSRV